MSTPIVDSVVPAGLSNFEDAVESFRALHEQARVVERELNEIKRKVGQARADRDVKTQMTARFHKRLRQCREKCAEKDAEIARLKALLGEAA